MAKRGWRMEGTAEKNRDKQVKETIQITNPEGKVRNPKLGRKTRKYEHES